MTSATTRRTICNRDCPDACAILATVENGKVVALRGDPEHPITRGFLCHRTNHFLTRQYSADRLTSPLLRKNGELKSVSWDEALDVAAERLLQIREQSGCKAIYHHVGGGSLGLLKAVISHFFQCFGPVTVKRGDICSGAGETAQELDFGVSDSNDLSDLTNSRQIILWGKNPVVSSPHLVPFLKDAKKCGAELVLIDPVFHRTAAFCDQYCQPRPGGDFALAMAVARCVFEGKSEDPEAGSYCDNLNAFKDLTFTKTVDAWCRDADVSPVAAEDLARRLTAGKPATILVGWGMGRRANGGAIVRAIDGLAAVTGNIGVPGGGVSFYFQRRTAFKRPFEIGPSVAPRSICEPLLGLELLNTVDPPIRAVWVTAANPVAMLPDSRTIERALKTREFVVVVDSFLTDTARAADLVLPTTTFLEDDDLLGAFGHHYVGASVPVVPPPDGVRSDLDIARELAKRVGLSDVFQGTAGQWKQRMAEPLIERGLTLEILQTSAVRNPTAPIVAFEGRRFPTPSGCVNLLGEDPDVAAASTCDEYPLILMAISTPRSQSSQWVELPEGPAVVTVHSSAAQGIADGAYGWLESRVGSIPVQVRHDDKQRRDVALMAKGGHLSRGHCANALIRAQTTDLGEGGVLYDEQARLVKTLQ